MIDRLVCCASRLATTRIVGNDGRPQFGQSRMLLPGRRRSRPQGIPGLRPEVQSVISLDTVKPHRSPQRRMVAATVALGHNSDRLDELSWCDGPDWFSKADSPSATTNQPRSLRDERAASLRPRPQIRLVRGLKLNTPPRRSRPSTPEMSPHRNARARLRRLRLRRVPALGSRRATHV